MADLPPLQPLPESNIPASLLNGQTAHSAEWAAAFGGQDTNIAQRARHNQDLTDYATALAEQRAQAQAQLIQQSQVAQNLYLGEQKLRLQEAEATARMAHANDMAPIRADLVRAQIAASGASEKRRALEAMQIADHTAGLNTGMLQLYQSGAHPNTPEFQTAAVDLLTQFPRADAKHVSELGKLAGFSPDLSSDEYISKAVEMKKAAAAAGLANPVVRDYKGKPVVVEGTAPHIPAASNDTYKKFNDELSAAVTAYGDQSKVPQEVWSAFEARKKALISGGAPPTAETSFDSPDAFKTAFANAPKGAVLHYKGTAYTKP